MCVLWEQVKRLGCWGGKTLGWPPVITASWGSSPVWSFPFEYGLDWLTGLYNRNDGTSLLLLGDKGSGFCLVQSLSLSQVTHSGESQLPWPDLIGGLPKTRGASLEAGPPAHSNLQMRQQPQLSARLNLKRDENERHPANHLDFWLMELWDNKCHANLLSLGIIHCTAIDN